MKFNELVKIIDGIKDPLKKRDLLTNAIILVKKQLATLNDMYSHLDMGWEEEEKEEEEDNGNMQKDSVEQDTHER